MCQHTHAKRLQNLHRTLAAYEQGGSVNTVKNHALMGEYALPSVAQFPFFLLLSCVLNLAALADPPQKIPPQSPQTGCSWETGEGGFS